MKNGKTSTQLMQVFKLLFISLLFIFPFKGMAQYDYEHYVPPFYCSFQVGKQELFLSTNSEKDLKIFIEDGQGKTVAGPFTISRNVSKTYIFTTPGGGTYGSHNSSTYPDGCSYPYGIIGPKDLNKPIDGQGLRIYSYDGPFFANIRHGYSNYGVTGALTHGGSLSAKGAYAKGQDFYSGHLYSHTINTGDPLSGGGSPIRSHFISVMAVEDGQTEVYFSGIKCKYITKYEGGKVVLQSINPATTITGTLSKGQSYVIGVNLYSSEFSHESVMVRNGMNGTHIKSTKKIVVNCGSWTAGAKPSQDIGFDQIVPVDQVRDKYIVMKGEGRAEPNSSAKHAGQERTIVVATQANTEVWVNEVDKGTLANAGDFMILDDIVKPKAIPTLYIDTKGKDVYVYQTMCGTNQDWTNIGLNFIPPLTGLGIKEVVIPNADHITSGTGGVINPTVTVLAQKNVDVQRNGISLSNPQDVPGTTEWVSYKVPSISGDSRFTGSKAINVAWTASSNTLGAAGYYSGFTKAVSPIHPTLDIDKELSLVCESYDADISVSINDPLPDFYEWYVNDSTDPFIENGPLVVPAPDVETTYTVLGYYRDPSLDILFNGDFSDGFNGFDSDYGIPLTGNLVEPGHFALASSPITENPILADYSAMDGGRMFLGYSKSQGEVIYQVNELPVEENFSYIFKIYGRLATDKASVSQSLKILINDEVIVENFKIDKSTEWQSVAALWKPGTARKATIKILNQNLDSQDTFFALDSITFVQAVQEDAEFVARVIPNFSTVKDDEVHFCKGVENSLDVANGDTSWYNYSWSKAGTPLENGDEYSGVKSHELVFKNPQESQEGIYVCTIGFKEAYKDCATSDATVDVNINVIVDEAATVSIDADKTSFCSGGTATLNALVTGDTGDIKWYVDGDTSPVSLENPYDLINYPAGTYKVRCEVENGCGLAADEKTINVLAAPELIGIDVSSGLCEAGDAVLTANLDPDYVIPTGGSIKYTWEKGDITMSEEGNILTFPVTMADRKVGVWVKAAVTYPTADGELVCEGVTDFGIKGLDIFPNVNLTPLEDITKCVGDEHTFKALLDYGDEYYNFKWFIDDVDQGIDKSKYVISPIAPGDEANYKVRVYNRCDADSSNADLTVTPEIIVNGFSVSDDGPFCIPTNVTATFDVNTTNGAVYIYEVIEPDGTRKTITNPYIFEVSDSHQGAWKFLVSGICDDPIAYTYTLNMYEDFGALTVADVGACIGQTVAFEASVSSIPDGSVLEYVWTDNLGNPIGTDSDQLEIVNVQDANLGIYKVVVTDQCGNTKTATAELAEEAVTSSDHETVTICEGDDFISTITYKGTPTFEWRFGNADSGDVVGNSATLSLTNVSLAQAGTYYCNITLACGNKTIRRDLIVNRHIDVDTSPVTIDICEGEKPELEVTVTGNVDDYTIAWTDAALTVLGSSSSTIQLAKHDAGTFTYKATVTGLCETFVKTYKVKVHAKPAISTLDNTLEECSGPISLEVSASGDHNGIVWWKDGSVITDGNADPTNFVLNPATSPSDDGDYIAKVESDYCGNAQVTINLDVKNTIEVTNKSPNPTVVCENEATNLFVTATGYDIKYKWYKSSDSGTILSDKSNLDLGNITLAKAGEYKCELTNDLNCGNQTLIFDVQVQKNATVTNPTNVVMCETDADPVFTVTGTGEAPVTYQWYDKNDVKVAGATTNTLTVTTPINGQSYYCVVSGIACSTATSNKASLTILKNVAVTDPLDLTIADGANASFSVVASGEPAYSYQWYENSGSGWNLLSNGGKYSGVNLAKLVITGADKATFDGNQYRCEVISSGAVCGSTITSNSATLTVTGVTKIAVQATSTTVCINTNASISVEGTSAGLTYTWYYKKGAGVYETAAGKDGISVSEVGKVSTLTILADDLDINNWKFKCLVSDGVSTDQYSNAVDINVLADIVVTTADATYTPCVGQTFSMSVSATGGDLKYKWYKVGAESTVLSTSASYNIGTVTVAKAGTYKCEVYNSEHCNDQIRSFVVDVMKLPTVTNPVDVTMCVTDADPDFKVVAGGDGPFTYQWYDNTGKIVGATSDGYTETSPVNGKYYYCEVTNSCKTVASGKANLIVVEELTVTDPTDLTIADGANAEFSVVASGEPSYSYVWEENSGSGWSPITEGGKYLGTNLATLKIVGVDQATFDGNEYRCIVTTSGDVCIKTVTSGIATLTVNLVDKIFIQPNNDRVCLNESATISIEGKAAGLTYDWEYYNGSVWADVATNAKLSVITDSPNKLSTLTVIADDLDINNWKFRCSVNTVPATTVQVSNSVVVEVLDNIVATSGKVDFVLCEDQALLMKVSATGDDLHYKWYKDSDPTTVLSTISNLSISEVSTVDAGDYTCKVYNDVNCNSQIVAFNVIVNTLATVTDPMDWDMCANTANPVFSVTGAGQAPLSYQWYNASGAIGGATSDSYTETSPIDGESYYCVVTNSCGSATSAVAKLTVYEEVYIVNDPIDVTIPDGGTAKFTVKAAGEPPYKYKWYVNSGSGWNVLSDGVNYSGVNSEELSVIGADKVNFDGNQYRCELTNSCNTVESAAATLTITSVAKILGQPDNEKVCLGGAVDFEITGKTSGLNYDWEYSTDGVVYTTVTGVSELKAVTDVDGSKLEIATATLAMNNWTFRCVVGDGVSAKETSRVASLIVVEPVAFDPIADENLCFGVEKQVSLANISGTGPISFSWSDGVSEVSTTSTVNIGAGDNGNYQVTASNGGICPDKVEDFDVLHYTALSLVPWSNVDQVCIGQTEELKVDIAAIDAAKTPSYKWYKDGVLITTATKASFSLVATNKNQTGQYKVEVSDGCSTETIFGYVNVYEPIASSTTWDTETTLCVDSELKLEAKVTGDVTSYVWTKNGAVIVGTTSSTYLNSSVAVGDAGIYKCIVSDNCGNQVVYTIDVTILDAPVITAGIDAITEVCEGDPLVLGPIAVTGTYDDVVWTLSDNSKNTTSGFSLDLSPAELLDAGNYKVTVSNICGSDVSLGKQVIYPTPILDPIASQTICEGNVVVFKANATGTNLDYQWLIDGADQFVNSSELVIDAVNVLAEDEDKSKTYNVVCNITSKAGCGDASQSTTLLVKPNTVLHATLKNVVKYVGESHTMTVEVSGVNLVFEWTFEPFVGSKVTLPETGSTINLTDIKMEDAGYYTCKIIGECGQRLASGKLTVKEPVTIISGLDEIVEKCEGDPLSLSISASGQITSIQWYKDGKVLTGETNLNLFIPSLVLLDAAVYDCKIIGEGTGDEGIIESTTVRVYSQTVLNSSLEDRTRCEGVSMDWIPDVEGSSLMSFQWTLNGADVSNEKILHYDAIELSDEGEYEIQVTSLCGDVSSSANLEVTELPVFVSISNDTTVCENTSLVEFEVEYKGEQLKYQWRKAGIDLVGQTSETLSLTNIQISDEGDYNCKVYSDCGEDLSPLVSLNVTPQLQVLSDMVDMEVCAGEDVLFTADVVGNDVKYQWKVDGVNVVDVPGEITGAKTSSLSIDSAQVAHTGYYTCILSDECTDYRSTKPTQLVVNALPNTEIYGRMILCAKEDRVTYMLKQVGADVYSWNVNGGLFAGPEEGGRTRVTWEELSPGSLSVEITNLETGCTSKVDSAVILNPLPDVSLTNLASKGVCEGEYELKGGNYPGKGIYWVNGISQTVFNPSERGAGTYAVHYSYTDENGCSNVTPTTDLTVDVLPVVSVIDTLSVGSCTPTQLTATTVEDNIQWYRLQGEDWVLPVDLDDPNSKTPIFTPGESQELQVKVIDEHGCPGIGILKLGVSPLPTIRTIADTTVGQCNQLVLETDVAGNSEDVITWTHADHLDHPNSLSPKIIDAPAGTYTYEVSVTDLYGCDASGEVTVTMVADPVLEEDKFGCYGEKFEVNVTGKENPVWDDRYTDPIRTIETPGKYLLKVSNEYGCGDEQLFVINPEMELGLKDTLVFEGQTVTFKPNLPIEYKPYFFEWQDGSIDHIFEVSETGAYKLKVEDNLGCIAIDSAFVEVKPVGIESSNAFLPLATDGINDKFYLGDGNIDMGSKADARLSIVKDFEMYVYDRWGELLYKTKEQGYKGGWNGEYKGKLCPAGAYVWILFINGELTNKGTVMLIR